MARALLAYVSAGSIHLLWVTGIACKLSPRMSASVYPEDEQVSNPEDAIRLHHG